MWKQFSVSLFGTVCEFSFLVYLHHFSHVSPPHSRSSSPAQLSLGSFDHSMFLIVPYGVLQHAVRVGGQDWISMPRRVQWWYGCLLLAIPLTCLPFWLPLSWHFLKPPGRSPDLFWEAAPNSSLIFVSVLLFPVRIALQAMHSVSIAILYLRHRLLWVSSATLFSLILPVLNNSISIANYSYAVHLLFQIAYEYLEHNGFLYFASSYPYIQRTLFCFIAVRFL